MFINFNFVKLLQPVQRGAAAERKPFGAILLVTKMVSVLIFGIFCPQPLGAGSKRAILGCLLQVWSMKTTLGVARNPEFGRGEGMYRLCQECPQAPAHKEGP